MLEIEWQKAQQDRDNCAFAKDKEKYLYKQGFCDGIRWSIDRFNRG